MAFCQDLARGFRWNFFSASSLGVIAARILARICGGWQDVLVLLILTIFSIVRSGWPISTTGPQVQHHTCGAV